MELSPPPSTTALVASWDLEKSRVAVKLMMNVTNLDQEEAKEVPSELRATCDLRLVSLSHKCKLCNEDGDIYNSICELLRSVE